MERSEIPATRATKDRSAEGTTDTGSVTMMTLKASPFNSRGCFVPPDYIEAVLSTLKGSPTKTL